MVNTNFASSLHDPVRGLDGPVSWLSYAFRFMQLPLGVFGVSMASATLPSISRSAAAGNMDEFRKTLSNSLITVFLLTVPSSVGLAILGKSIIGSIYQHGKFGVYDTQQTAFALSFYAIGLSGYAALKVLNPRFLRTRRRQNSHAGKPCVHSCKLRRRLYYDSPRWIRARGTGVIDFCRGTIRLCPTLRNSAQTNWRNPRSAACIAIGKNCRRIGLHGWRCVSFEPGNGHIALAYRISADWPI